MNKSESKYFNTAVKMDLALIGLLKEKPFSYITVSELCKAAGVNRSTFYLHYETLGDLLEETTRYLLNSFLSLSQNNESKGYSCTIRGMGPLSLHWVGTLLLSLHPLLIS